MATPHYFGAKNAEIQILLGHFDPISFQDHLPGPKCAKFHKFQSHLLVERLKRSGNVAILAANGPNLNFIECFRFNFFKLLETLN